MPKIIECVPNVSEGRNYRTIEKLANQIRLAPEVQLLDVHWDEDHNRSVYTFIGTPNGVFQAVYNMSELAIELIDVNKNDGVHPFVGVVDVVPFIPVKDATEKDCLQVAVKLGEEVEKHLHVPVYFYGEATTDPKTKNLADLRAQSYNFKKHKTAGAIAIGVRDYLVAYNINLATSNVEIAKEIAVKIREKNGGLLGVKALGFKLKSKKCVQVSMNLIQPKVTAVGKVLIEIEKLTKKLKVEIVDTEVVGLLPEEVKEVVGKSISL